MAAAALVLCLTGAFPAFGVIPGREAPVPVRDTYNPRPDANDILLPMPCDLEMALRAVVTPGGAAFYIGKYEVSGYQWNAVMSGECGALSAGAGALPVRERPPSEVREFLARYNAWLAKEGRGDAGLFAEGADGAARLPTASEWEFAARGGLAVSDAERGRDIPQDKLREYGVISDPTPIQTPERIGSLKPNPLGLYDTVGNVKEMVASSEAAIAFKGGSFRHTPGEVRLDGQDEITSRNERGEERRVSDLGFRVALSGAGYDGTMARRALRPEQVGTVTAAANWPLVAAFAAAAFLLGGLVVWLLARRRDAGEAEAQLREEAVEWTQQFKELKTALRQARKEAAAREEARLAAEKQADEYRALLDRARQELEAREQARRAADDQLRKARAELEALRKTAAEVASAQKRQAAFQPPPPVPTPGRRRDWRWAVGMLGALLLACLFFTLAQPPPSVMSPPRQEKVPVVPPSGQEKPPVAPPSEQRKPPVVPPPRQENVPVVPPSGQASALTNSIGMEFVLIPAGTFQMGCSASESEDDCWSNEKPRHTVTISRPFYLGKYEVTQAQWKSVMGNNPSRFESSNRPVERVSWEDAQEFIQKLNAREGHTRYRLPTEAEWEYAARAGTTTAYGFGNDPRQLGSYAWYSGNSDSGRIGGATLPVGRKQPNKWGLHDIHGNVWEWVGNWDGSYRVRELRVIRGGSWRDGARSCRSSVRISSRQHIRVSDTGFRLALSPE